MVVLRMQRIGTKKVPHFRVVAMEKGRAQGSRALETLGSYDAAKDPAVFKIDESRLVFWISSGAQVSRSLQHLVKRFKKISVAAARG